MQGHRVEIDSDGILEVDEQFNVSLTLNTTAEEESRVILQPDTAVVTIIDNNGGWNVHNDVVSVCMITVHPWYNYSCNNWFPKCELFHN